MTKSLQLLVECNLEDLAKEVVKHFCDKQAPSVCSLQQAQTTKEYIGVAPRHCQGLCPKIDPSYSSARQDRGRQL